MPRLAPSQIGQFLSEGFLVVDHAFSPSTLDALIAEFTTTVDRNAAIALEDGLIVNTFPDEPFEKRLARVVESAPDPVAANTPGCVLFENLRGKHKSDAMFDLMTHPDILEIVESIIGPEILAHPQFNVRAKLPNQDQSVVPWHQDLGYLELDAQDTLMVNFWLPLVDSNKENGCLEVIPGSHQVYVDHVEGLGPAGNFKGIPDDLVDNSSAVSCPVPKGGVLLIQHRTIHRSVPNTSKTIRWSLDLRYSDPALPTGRDGVPGFIARSESDPNRAASSLNDWLSITP